MSDQPPSQQSSDKTFSQKLKDFIWNGPWSVKARRAGEMLILAGGICYLPWMTNDALSPDYPWYRVYLVLLGVAFLLLHIVASVRKEMPECAILARISAMVVYLSILSFVGWKRWEASRHVSELSAMPHIRIGISTSPTNFVWLTNRLLINEQLSKTTSWAISNFMTDSGAWVFIVKPTGQTNVKIWPILTNISEFDGSKLHLQFSVLRSSGCTAANGWEVDSGFGGETSFDWRRSGVFRKHDSFALPGISFDNPFPLNAAGEAGWRAPFTAILTVNDVRQPILTFWIAVVESTQKHDDFNIGVFDGKDLKFTSDGKVLVPRPH